MARLKKDLAARKATILPITEAISNRATTLLESHLLSHGLQMADALIAATAIEHDIAIATANTRHFQAIEGLRVTRFQA